MHTHSQQVDETKEASKPAANSSSNKAGGSTKKNTKQDKAGFGGFGLEGHYAECYPGYDACLFDCMIHSLSLSFSGFEEFDGNYDSDEDADYTKMDMVSSCTQVRGNKYTYSCVHTCTHTHHTGEQEGTC